MVSATFNIISVISWLLDRGLREKLKQCKYLLKITIKIKFSSFRLTPTVARETGFDESWQQIRFIYR